MDDISSWTRIARRLNARPPDGPQNGATDRPTLIFSWICTGASIILIALRLLGRWKRSRTLFQEDKVMLASIIPLLARMGLVHVILIWGTNNVELSNNLSAQDIHHRSIGSRLVLASRVFYAMFIWMAKFTVSEFLKRLTASYWRTSYQMVLHCIRIFLVVSFIGVVIAILAECQPFDHYWQVVPDPGPHCRQAYAQLWTMAMADIVTDTLLVVFPLSILLPATGIPLLRRIRISFLFALSAANIIITSWRVASVVRTHGSQQRRTIFASSEILAAAAVANAVILASFVRGRGVRRPTWQSENTNQDTNAGGTATMLSSKARSIVTPNGNANNNLINYSIASPSGSISRTVSRRPTLMTRLTEAGSSDEELFSGMCYRPAKSDEEDGIDSHEDSIGAPPIARPAQSISREQMSRHLSISIPLDDKDMTADDFPPDSSNSPTARRGSVAGGLLSGQNKTVTFSDPGGLLAKAPSRASTVAALDDEHLRQQLQLDSTEEDTIAPMSGRRRWRSIGSDTSTRAGTIAELQDAGGLLDSQTAVSGTVTVPAVAVGGAGAGRRATVDVIPRLSRDKEMSL